MARALMEVSIALRLPENPVSALLTAHPHARIVLAPVGVNGTSTPKRLLVSVHALEADPEEMQQALAGFFDDIQDTQTDATGVHHLIADLNEDLGAHLIAHMQTFLDADPRDVLHPPSLLTGHQLYCSIVTLENGHLEEGIRRLIESLNGKGMEARLLHLRPYRPSQNPGNYEDALTDKQSEFLRVALALGLYDTPRRVRLESIASMFGISKAAAHNRMRNAERKILQQYFER